MSQIQVSDENLTKEREEKDNLKRAIVDNLDYIREELMSLTSCWQDEKSEKWISDQIGLVEELKVQSQKNAIATDDYFDAIIEQVKIYKNI